MNLSKNDPSSKLKPGWFRFRLMLVMIVVFLAFSLVFFRLLQLQVFDDPHLDFLVQKQFEKIGQRKNERHPILDRNGEELAVNVLANSVYAHPKQVGQKWKAAQKLGRILRKGHSGVLEKLKSPKPFVWIQRQVSDEMAHKLSALHLKGIHVSTENKRLYPHGKLAANVLGFTNVDGKGLTGLESVLNEDLFLKGSSYRLSKDGRGVPSYINEDEEALEPSLVGVSLTIDRRIQFILEEELEKAHQETKSNSVFGAVIDPFTGEILAMGQSPTFDPNAPSLQPTELQSNKMVSHLFEPGSIIKPIFAAETFEQGLLHPKSVLDCGNGTLKIGDDVITEAESHHAFKDLPVEKIIRFSSNIGAVRIAQTLGIQRVRSTIQKFGLTNKTQIFLPAEISGSERSEKLFVPVFLATVGFGQGISTNPLQMMMAYGAFANGGYLLRPRILLKEVLSSQSHQLDTKRILSSRTIDMVRDILVSVTEDEGGTGLKAAIPGVRVAGKTGTAQKFDASLGYRAQKYYSSFIGFLPADEPKLLVGVMLDEPKGVYYASETAAPLFKRISERSLQVLGKFPKISIAEHKVSKEHKTIRVEETSIPTIVRRGEGEFVMPELGGMSMREVLIGMGNEFKNIKMSGEGYLVSQLPKAGSTIHSRTPIQLRFSPLS